MEVALRKFWAVIDLVIAAVLLGMIVLVFVNVVLRYGFSSGIREAIELSRLGLVWLVMVGAAVVLRRNGHLAVHEIVMILPKAIMLALRRAAYLVILIAVLMIFWGTWKQTSANWQNISPLTGLPSGVFYLAGVISSALMIVIAVVRVINPDARLDGGHDEDIVHQEFDL